MSNPIETYGKSVHTEFKLQLCKEYLKQTCLWLTNKLHPWEYCARFYMVCRVGGPYQRSMTSRNLLKTQRLHSETHIRTLNPSHGHL